jgi:hypothetical protein
VGGTADGVIPTAGTRRKSALAEPKVKQSVNMEELDRENSQQLGRKSLTEHGVCWLSA